MSSTKERRLPKPTPPWYFGRSLSALDALGLILHELGHGLLTAEAISLAFELPIDGAVGLRVFAGCETHRAM